jgi:hypothetical protein
MNGSDCLVVLEVRPDRLADAITETSSFESFRARRRAVLQAFDEQLTPFGSVHTADATVLNGIQAQDFRIYVVATGRDVVSPILACFEAANSYRTDSEDDIDLLQPCAAAGACQICFVDASTYFGVVIQLCCLLKTRLDTCLTLV